MTKKGNTAGDRRVMSYFHHVIWYGDGVYMFAKGDGTDYYFDTLEGAMEKIEELEKIE